MEIKKACKTCGKEFTAIKSTQYFCSRKCFRKDYHHRKREEAQKMPPKFPAYSCPNCDRRSLLDFDPAKNMARFDAHKCPYCEYTPRSVWTTRKVVQKHVKILSFGAFSSTALFNTTVSTTTLL